MASLRSASRLLRSAINSTRPEVPRRCVSSKTAAGAGYGAFRPLLLGGVAAVGAYGAYTVYNKHSASLSRLEEVLPRVHAASKVPEYQPSVTSGTKDHALYMWIHLKPNANAKACAKVVANLQALIDQVCPADLRDESDEIWGGVGFGPNFYNKVVGKARKNYNYPHRSGALGDLPSTGGDIFIHAKSNNVSKLFELAHEVTKKLPPGSVDKFMDIYGWVYRNGRDLTGFIDGTENAADDEEREEVAVERETGGSYVITQKWIHQLDVIGKEKDSNLEKFVGRQIDDSTELKKKPITSHVARMTGGNQFEQKKVFQIVRQSQPYGNHHDHAGLFFIGYAASPENFEFMLKRMVGQDKDGNSDDIMKLTKCVAGTYWYFPGAKELKKLQ